MTHDRNRTLTRILLAATVAWAIVAVVLSSQKADAATPSYVASLPPAEDYKTLRLREMADMWIDNHAPAYRRPMGAAGVAALLSVLVWGITAVGFGDAANLVTVVVLAGVSGYAAALASLLIVPPAIALWNGWREAIRAHRQEVRRWREREETKRHTASLPPLPPPPPPPVPMEERLEKAREEARKRIALIEATAELEEDDRVARKNAVLDQLNEELRRIMGHVV